MKKNVFNRKPETLIFYSFFLAIFMGMLLLRLPFSSTGSPVSWLDALFMSTSAVCVTGLSVVDIGKDLSLFGQMVILTLIQMGGLGIMTFSFMFLIALGKQISLHSQLCIQGLSQDLSLRNIKYSLYTIFIMTFLIEGGGAVFLFMNLKDDHSLSFAIYSSIFHSVSAFCNAGLSLYPDNLMGFQRDPFVMFILMTLIVLGGLGFIVIYEVFRTTAHKAQGCRKIPFSLHTKIALFGSFLLITVGAGLIWILEQGGILKGLPVAYQIENAFFLSITSRTAGFNTIETSALSNSTLYLLALFMFIGACPGSTAGGIKIHTFFTLTSLIRSKFLGIKTASLFGRKIPDAIVDRALLIFISSFFLMIVSVFVLQVTENFGVEHLKVSPDKDFISILFEAVSAFGTVGLSTGVTPYLSDMGKLIIIFLMFVGRIGPLALGITLQMKQERKIVYEFPNEEIIVN